MKNKTYLFQPDKKFLKQGYFMQDEEGNIVYEAKVLKQPLFGAITFEFVNHLSNIKEEHKVGHTITSEQTGGIDVLSTKSHFKYDGKNIWDYLHEQGIRIDSKLSKGSIGMSYNITLKGEEIANITMASPNGSKIITSSHVYNVQVSEENIELAFLTTFAIARTDQTFYN